jgi:hypothetical protein
MFIVPLVPQIRKLIEANPLLLSSTDQFFVALEGFRNSELHKLPNLKEANRKIGIRLASKTSP